MSSGVKLVLGLVLALFVGTGIYVAFVAPPPATSKGTTGAGGTVGGVTPNEPKATAPKPSAPQVAPRTNPPATPAPAEPKPEATPIPAPGPAPAPPSSGRVSDPLAAPRNGERPPVDPNAQPQSGGKGDVAPAQPAAEGPTVTPPAPGGGTQPEAPKPAPPAGGGTPPATGPTPVPNGPTPAGPTPAPGPKPAPPAAPTGTKTHEVQSGDTMTAIAEKYYGDRSKWDVIAKANPLVDPAAMKVGTKLVIPPLPVDAPKPAGGTAPPAAPATAPGEQVHEVAAGDTLIALARKYYDDPGLWERIYDANRKVIGDDPEALKVGMKLVIPAKKK